VPPLSVLPYHIDIIDLIYTPGQERIKPFPLQFAMLFQAHIFFTVNLECYKILQKKIMVLQIVTFSLFCGYALKKTVASLVVICFFRGKAQGCWG